ncbi:HNH endonuclease [Janthinobacterium sp.]|uniref:HNH endonuclease n=1 Tax=Janthinobacterium sp. TaxID=1871054 RepID=UPI00293D64BB|nr:HNH endonuclease [Janthinobacterium sp.]
MTVHLSQEDGREWVLRAVVRRQGQPQFRAALIDAYDARCAITGCALLVILEAAHITPYLGPETNSVSNGLLLRADIHTLWDLALIAIDPTTMLLAVSLEVNDVAYLALIGTLVYQPLKASSRPSMAALRQQWSMFHESARSSSVA